MDSLRKWWNFGIGRTVLAAFCAHSVSISIGICQGYSAILIPQLNSSNHISSEESSWLASLGAVTNPVGAILSGVLAEYFGRKRSIQVSSLPFFLGWLCIGLGPNIQWLYTGRLISGIAAGMASASYTYVSEIATPTHRGFLQSLGPICASFGIFLTYILGYFLTWRQVALISSSFAVFTLVAVQTLPESPAYLTKKNNTHESFQSYLYFRRSNAIAQTEIDNAAITKQQKSLLDPSQGFLSPATIKPFFVLVTLFLLQELSGIYTILFYAVSFFEETGVKLDNYVSSIVVGSIRFTMSIIAAVLITRFGRKTLCMSSSAGMGVAMLIMAAFFKYYELFPEEERILPYLPLVCVVMNVCFSMVGMLPIPWILVGEMFPLEVRSIMMGVVICIAQCFIFICVKIYPDMIHYLSFSGTLITFFAASMLALVFTKTVLPETKNKSLQEIEDSFKKDDLECYDNKAFTMQPEKDRINSVVHIS